MRAEKGKGWTGPKKVGKYVADEEKDMLLTPQYSQGQGVTLRSGTHVGKDHYSNVPQVRNMGDVHGPTEGVNIPEDPYFAGMNEQDTRDTAKRVAAKRARQVGSDAE